MIDIKLKCEQSKLSLLKEPVYIAEGCVDYVRASFEFDRDWLTMTEVVVTFKHGNRNTVSVPVVNNECIVPAEVIKYPEFKIAVFGSDGTVHITTTVLTLPILLNDIGQGVPPAPTPDIFDTLMETVRTALAAVEDFKARADAGEFDGRDFSYWKTYVSVVDMQADKAAIPDGAYVNINTGNAEDADNSKVYRKTGGELVFTADHSGSKGAKGDRGNAATVAVKSTETLPAGSSAAVTNEGTASEAQLSFKIPKGDKGDPGRDGSGITTALDPGYFIMSLEGDGNLYVSHNDNEPAPPLTINGVGELVYNLD